MKPKKNEFKQPILEPSLHSMTTHQPAEPRRPPAPALPLPHTVPKLTTLHPCSSSRFPRFPRGGGETPPTRRARHAEGPAAVPAGSTFLFVVEENHPSRKQERACPSQAHWEFSDVRWAEGQSLRGRARDGEGGRAGAVQPLL